MSSHLLYPGGWVKTTIMSKKFTHKLAPCALCGYMSCGPYWLKFPDLDIIVCKKCMGDPFERGESLASALA